MVKLKNRVIALFMTLAMVIGYGLVPVSAADSETPSGTTYFDGVYQGSGIGYDDGEIVVDVTISGGEIEKIELVSQEKQSYWYSCGLETLFPKMVTANSAEVDAIAGATESSDGVKAAVRAALQKAAAAPETDAFDPTAVLGQSVNTAESAIVYYAGQQWNVIGYNGQGVASSDGSMTLLLKGTLGATGFNSMSDYDSNEYGSSQYYRAISKLITSDTYGVMTNINFNESERNAIIKRTLESGTYQADSSCDGVSGSAVADQLVWPLSTKEAGQVDAALRVLNPENTKDTPTTRWWLRSPGSSDYYAATVGSDGSVIAAGKPVTNSQAFRPAFNLGAESIAFVLAAGTDAQGANGLTAVAENADGTWKLTLKDDAHSAFALGDVLSEDNSISVSYTGAVTGEQEYISAAVVNGSAVKYYGHIKALSSAEDAEGTATIDLSGISMTDGDQLYVFNEQDNGANTNNIGSALYAINLTSKDAPSFTQQPVSVTVEEGEFAEFKALASGDPAPEYTWQVNNGSGWTDIEDADDYDYIISKVDLSQNGYKFRCVAANSHGKAYSSSATLTVTERQLADFVITANPNVKAWGTVSGTGVHVEGTEVTLKAVPNSGYQFVAWVENDQQVSTDAEYTFTADANRTLTAVFEDASAPGKADYQKIYQGAGQLGEGANTAAAATVWYGGQKWVVVGFEGNGIVSGEETMTLLAADAIGTSKYADGETSDAYYGNEYAKSALKTAVDAIANGFTESEKDYVQTRDLTSGTHNNGWPYDDIIKGDAVQGAMLWPLSPYEISNDSVSLNSALKNIGADWWLRSPGSGSYYAAVVSASGFTNAGGTTVNKLYGVRPAFLLKTNDILLITSTASGKSSNGVGADALTPAQGGASDSWKLTMHTDAYDTFALGDTLRDGNELTVSYTGAVTGENMYISAVIKGEDGTIKYYGRLKQLTDGMENGEAALDLSDVKMAADDTVYLFNEQYNGGYSTDFAGKLQPLTVSKLDQSDFAFSETQINKIYGDADFTVIATGAQTDSTVTYASSDEKVAAVDADTGLVTIKGVGTTVITATASETASYNAATAQYTLTVSKKTVTMPFTDVKSGSYYEDAVYWGVENGIIYGTTETTFEPNTNCTRAQAVSFLWRAAGSPEPKTTEMPFRDVGKNAYYYKAVLWGYENGIVSGTSKTTFEPNLNCTRAQFVSFLWRERNKPEAETEIPFTDVPAGAYYEKAVQWAVEQGITAGTTKTTFGPNETCTRAHAVTFLYNAS